MKAQVHAAIAAGCMVALGLAWALGSQAASPTFDLQIEQVTSGSKHHFFGYIGQCRTVPWNASGRYILGLEIDHVDRMPSPEDSATVILVDTHQGNRIRRIDRTHAWNPQQGTMFYWHPLSPETQFFFIYRLSDGSFARSPGIDRGPYGGNIRIDPAPRWNRTSDAILVPGIAENKTRQIFLIRVLSKEEPTSVSTSNGP